MKLNIRFICLIFCLLLGISSVMAEDTSLDDSAFLTGKWAYDYEENRTQMELNSNGKAVFEGTKYEWKVESPYIILTKSKSEPVCMRYMISGEEIYIYKIQTYQRVTEAVGGLVGAWKGIGNKWSFEFTSKGTFREDGYFPGYYTTDEVNGTFTLVYVDHFADTTCWYTIEDDILTVEYPWRMLRVE